VKKTGIRKLARETSFLRAVRKVWQAGLNSLRNKELLETMAETSAKLEQEHLKMSRLVHEYETKLQSLIRNNAELVQKNKELEWGYRALQRENHWMREELFARRRSAMKNKGHTQSR